MTEAAGLSARLVDHMVGDRAGLEKLMELEGSRALHEEFLLAESGTLPDRQTRLTRVRITGSIYTVSQAARTYLYAGDRAGARYYNVVATSTDDFRTGRFDPGFRNELTAIMVNPFVKFMGFEFYGVFENSSGKAASETDTRTFNQYGAEALYRVGEEENFYLGGRYNLVKGKTSANEDVEINRINVGGGWFLTKNILAKLEYVKQQYKGFNPASIYAGAEFSGVALEAVVSF